MNTKFVAVAAASVFVAAGSASAGVSSWSGQLQMVGQTENPVSFAYGALANNEAMSLFEEAQSFTLEQPLMIDIPGESGTYHRFNRPTTIGTIEAGTLINSYFIHQDLVGNNPNQSVIMEFSITFEQPIIGLILGGDWHDGEWFRTTLDDSDYLAGPGVTHTKNSDLRKRGALEGSALAEFLTISEDGTTLSGSLHTLGVHVDNVRVITMGSVIPTPGTAALLGLAGVVMYRCRRN
jgi:hypothetical protein